MKEKNCGHGKDSYSLVAPENFYVDINGRNQVT